VIPTRPVRRAINQYTIGESSNSDPEAALPGRSHLRLALFLLCVLSGPAGTLGAEDPSDTLHPLAQLDWSTDSTQPGRFIAAHGRRSAIFGYSESGLESWAYPVQILTSFGVAFRQQGTTTEIDGRTVLRRIIYGPASVTRIYSGPDFIVREKLFTPLDAPGTLVSYEVAGARPLDILIRFVPVLDLMWPGSVGGQEINWSSAASAYLLSEPTGRYTAFVGSPDIVAHDDTANSNKPAGRAGGLAFTIRAGGGHSGRVVIAAGMAGQDATAIAKRLLNDSTSLEEAAVDHYEGVLNHALQIETPDPLVNRALSWSEIALDQAWVCNPDLGCGQVAGYGPSRKARRPQYDWFFAGDGLVSIRALLALAQYERAREELEFILKFRDRNTGMIWHELSQSAGTLKWDQYPYMYVHVDVTFDFLGAVADYYSTTGDLGFVTRNWDALQSAYRYCRSLLDPKEGLPRIPSDKQGHNEQDPLNDELTLSVSWLTASEAFADLAAAAGHQGAAKAARNASQRARQAIGRRYWDPRQQIWISGHTRTGEPVVPRDSRAASTVQESLFSAQQRASLLDQLSSHEFQTDWGTRGKASSSTTYDPNSYASGSVWAIGTAAVADAFWAEHRPVTALPVWSGLLPWLSLDSLGHMHETLAGDYYHEELESVPEQTWSSASFLSSTVHGLLGLRVDGVSRHLSFAPHLPPDWNAITLRHLRVGGAEITLSMLRSADQIRLEARNEGPPITLVFNPELPFGAQLTGARAGDRPITATLEQNPQDTHAHLQISLPRGNTVLTVSYAGGVSIIPAPPHPAIGEPSTAIKVTGVALQDGVLTIEFDHIVSAQSSFELRTPWAIKDAQGADFATAAPAVYRFTVNAAAHDGRHEYERSKVVVRFAGLAQ
jgi:glycogen debranching enzyme